MKTFKKYARLFAFIYAIVFLSSTSVGYGFMDNKNSSDSLSLSIGNWSTQLTYFTGFESFTNTNTATITQVIDNLSFDLTNVIAGTLGSDQKNGTTSARVLNTGSITTTNYYKGYKTISFYVGMSTAGNTNGSYSFTVQVSNNGTGWTTVLTQSKPVAALTFYTVNMQQLLTNGITLADNSVANANTNLKVRITFAPGGQSGSRIFNLDDLTIIHTI